MLESGQQNVGVATRFLTPDSKMAKLKIFFFPDMLIIFLKLLLLKYFPRILIFTWQIAVIFVVVVTITKPRIYSIMTGKNYVYEKLFYF